MTGVTKIIRLGGESHESIEDAISAALARAALTIHEIRSYEVVKVDGEVDDSGVPSFHVTIDVTFGVKESIHP